MLIATLPKLASVVRKMPSFTRHRITTFDNDIRDVVFFTITYDNERMSLEDRYGIRQLRTEHSYPYDNEDPLTGVWAVLAEYPSDYTMHDLVVLASARMQQISTKNSPLVDVQIYSDDITAATLTHVYREFREAVQRKVDAVLSDSSGAPDTHEQHFH